MNEDKFAKILDEKLQPINVRLTKLESRFSDIEDRLTKVEDRLTKVEDRLSKLEKGQQRLERITKKIQHDLNTLINRYDRETTKFLKRFRRIEDHVELTRWEVYDKEE